MESRAAFILVSGRLSPGATGANMIDAETIDRTILIRHPASVAHRISGVTTPIGERLMNWVEMHRYHLARIALSVVYLWFGVLKLAGLSPANAMIHSLEAKTLPFLSFDHFIIPFALFEICIGVLFAIPKATRIALILFVAHMVMATMPLILLPGRTWQSAFVPTMEGQYIIKDIVLIALAGDLAISRRRRFVRKIATAVLW